MTIPNSILERSVSSRADLALFIIVHRVKSFETESSFAFHKYDLRDLSGLFHSSINVQSDTFVLTEVEIIDIRPVFHVSKMVKTPWLVGRSHVWYPPLRESADGAVAENKKVSDWISKRVRFRSSQWKDYLKMACNQVELEMKVERRCHLARLVSKSKWI